MKKTNGLSPNQERIMSILEYKKRSIVTRMELLSLIKKYLTVKDSTDLIEKLLKKRRLVSVSKGVYMIIPFTSISKEWALEGCQIIDYLLKDKYYIGSYNAFNLHGFTGQIPNKIFVFNTRYSADKKILHFNVKFFKIKPEKLFGIVNYKYPYSDKERTIIDVLEHPEYVGGLGEAIARIQAAAYNKKILGDYAIKYASTKIMKIVGFLTGSDKIYNVLKMKDALSYYTTITKTRMRILDKKWKLRLI